MFQLPISPIIPHSILLAKLNPVESSRSTSSLGDQAAQRLDTKPFIALRIWKDDVGLSSAHESALCLMSPEKPEGFYKGYYLTIVQNKERSEHEIQITPSPPFLNRPWYIYTIPLLDEPYTYEDIPIETCRSIYQFSERGLQNLAECLIKDIKEFEKQFLTLQPPSSGGDDQVGEDWSSWSATSKKENGSGPHYLHFDYLDFDDKHWLLTPEVILERDKLRQ